MGTEESEDELLRSVALQNARTILLARERAEKGFLLATRELERKGVELSQQREWFKVTLSSIGDGVLTTDTNGNITFLNPVAEGMTGWSLADALGKPLHDVFVIIHEETRLPVENPISVVLREGVVVSLANHTTLIARDGHETAIEDSASPIRDAGGSIMGAVMVFHDVTEKRRRDEALRTSELFNRSIIESSRDCIKVLDLQGNLLSMSTTVLQILGLTDFSALLHKPWLDFWDGEDRHAAMEALQAAMRGEVGSFVGSFKTKSGETKWWDVIITSIINSAGMPDRLLVVSRDVTERKQAEEGMVRLAAMVESSNDAILSMSLQGVITSWNKGAERMYGHRAEDIVGKTVYTLIPPGRLDEEKDILFRVKRGDRIDQYETERRTRDGRILQVSLTVSPIMDKRGTIIGVSKISRDISEKKRSEEALRRNEEDLRAMANSIPQLAWMAAADGDIFWYNQRWYEYTGTNLEQMKGWGWQNVHDPKILPQVMEKWTESIRTGEPFNMEFPLRGADGRFRWFLTRVNPVINREGKVERWFGTNTDVDDVRQVQDALKEETRILELLNDTGRVIASNLNLQSLVQSVTDSATKLSGAKFGAFFYNVTNQDGESFLLYTLSGAPREAFERFGMPRNTPIFNTTFSGEAVLRSADITKDPRYGTMSPHHGMPKGHLPVRSYLAAPVISRSGEVIGGLFFGHPEPDIFTERSEKLVLGVAAQAAIAIDNARLYDAAQKEIAERRKAEDALRLAQKQLSSHAEDLENQVAERTGKLRETIDELESFSYSVSHDLRAPLRAMQSFAIILAEECAPQLSDDGKHYIKRITTAAERMDKLIQDVLTFSRLSRAETPLTEVKLAELLKGTVDSYPAFQPPRAEIELAGVFPNVIGAEAVLGQCISNLLGNAVKFVPKGVTPRVKVWAEPTHGGTMVKVIFKDNGVGVPKDAHQKIFGIFERVSNDYEGTGIGLSIVKKGVERMGGSVGLQSEMGAGSSFWLELKTAPGGAS